MHARKGVGVQWKEERQKKESRRRGERTGRKEYNGWKKGVRKDGIRKARKGIAVGGSGGMEFMNEVRR